ncbi:MAG: hypothetical protein C0469_15115, partial [Cyanobacteria bacterium DS2.3.42]|nr:hypothetical protein [Cyanobacteria bacterium DS2.3.42]
MADPIENKPNKPPESAESATNSPDNESTASLSVFRSPIAPKSEGEQRNRTVNAAIVNSEIEIDTPIQRPVLKNNDKLDAGVTPSSIGSAKSDVVANTPVNKNVPVTSAEKPVDVPKGIQPRVLDTPQANGKLVPQEAGPSKVT